MYCSHFQLHRPAFNNTPDPTFYYSTPEHEEALATLQYAARQRKGFVLVTGDVGAGKTLTARMFLRNVDSKTETAVITQTSLSGRQLLAAICAELEIDIPARADNLELTQRLQDHLLEQFAQDRYVVVLLDEAQNLPDESLEELRMLGNLEAEDAKLLQVCILGQPELRERLARQKMKQLDQRIFRRFHLSALSEEQTSEYIRHRLQVAGASREIFTKAAIERIFQASAGIPRLINVICENALLAAYARESQTVDVEIIDEVTERDTVTSACGASQRGGSADERIASSATSIAGNYVETDRRIKEIYGPELQLSATAVAEPAEDVLDSARMSRSGSNEPDPHKQRVDHLHASTNLMRAGIERIVKKQQKLHRIIGNTTERWRVTRRQLDGYQNEIQSAIRELAGRCRQTEDQLNKLGGTSASTDDLNRLRKTHSEETERLLAEIARQRMEIQQSIRDAESRWSDEHNRIKDVTAASVSSETLSEWTDQYDERMADVLAQVGRQRERLAKLIDVVRGRCDQTEESLTVLKQTVLDRQAELAERVDSRLSETSALMDRRLSDKADRRDLDVLGQRVDQAQAGLDRKVDRDKVEWELSAKADQEQIQELERTKADRQQVRELEQTKAERQEMESLRESVDQARKADLGRLDQELSAKADRAEMESCLAAKADREQIQELERTKADRQQVRELEQTKAERQEMESLRESVDQARKADLGRVEQELSAKADRAEMESCLAVKADREKVQELEQSKAERQEMESLRESVNQAQAELVDHLDEKLTEAEQELGRQIETKAEQNELQKLREGVARDRADFDGELAETRTSLQHEIAQAARAEDLETFRKSCDQSMATLRDELAHRQTQIDTLGQQITDQFLATDASLRSLQESSATTQSLEQLREEHAQSLAQLARRFGEETALLKTFSQQVADQSRTVSDQQKQNLDEISQRVVEQARTLQDLRNKLLSQHASVQERIQELSDQFVDRGELNDLVQAQSRRNEEVFTHIESNHQAMQKLIEGLAQRYRATQARLEEVASAKVDDEAFARFRSEQNQSLSQLLHMLDDQRRVTQEQYEQTVSCWKQTQETLDVLRSTAAEAGVVEEVRQQQTRQTEQILATVTSQRRELETLVDDMSRRCDELTQRVDALPADLVTTDQLREIQAGYGGQIEKLAERMVSRKAEFEKAIEAIAERCASTQMALDNLAARAAVTDDLEALREQHTQEVEGLASRIEQKVTEHQQHVTGLGRQCATLSASVQKLAATATPKSAFKAAEEALQKDLAWLGRRLQEIQELQQRQLRAVAAKTRDTAHRVTALEESERPQPLHLELTPQAGAVLADLITSAQAEGRMLRREINDAGELTSSLNEASRQFKLTMQNWTDNADTVQKQSDQLRSSAQVATDILVKMKKAHANLDAKLRSEQWQIELKRGEELTSRLEQAIHLARVMCDRLTDRLGEVRDEQKRFDQALDARRRMLQAVAKNTSGLAAVIASARDTEVQISRSQEPAPIPPRTRRRPGAERVRWRTLNVPSSQEAEAV